MNTKVADGVVGAFPFAGGFAASFPVVNFNVGGCGVCGDINCFVCVNANVEGFAEFGDNVCELL